MFSKGLQNEIYDLNSYMKRWGLWAISGSRIYTLWGQYILYGVLASESRTFPDQEYTYFIGSENT